MLIILSKKKGIFCAASTFVDVDDEASYFFHDAYCYSRELFSVAFLKSSGSSSVVLFLPKNVDSGFKNIVGLCVDSSVGFWPFVAVGMAKFVQNQHSSANLFSIQTKSRLDM